MRKKSTRLLSAALAVCMMLSVLPVGAFALEPGEDATNAAVSTQEETEGYHLNDGVTINEDFIKKHGNTYTIGGNEEYRYSITIDTTEDVTINFVDNTVGRMQSFIPELKHAMIEVKKVNKLTINNQKNYKYNAKGYEYIMFLWVKPGAAQEVEVNGGIYQSTFNTFLLESGRVTLNDVQTVDDYGNSIYNQGATVTVNNGRYSATNAKNRSGDLIYNNGGTLYLNNVEVDAQLTAVRNYSGEVVINGGTYTSRGAYTAVSNAGTMKIMDGKFETKEAAAVSSGKNLEIQGGTFTGGKENGSGIYISGDAPATIENATIKGNKYGIRFENPQVTLKSAEFEDNEIDIYLTNDRNTPTNAPHVELDESTKDTAGAITVEVAHPAEGVQITTKTTGEDYQQNLKLTGKNDGWLIGYKKDTDGEYRYLTQREGNDYYGLNTINATATTGEGDNVTTLEPYAQVKEDTEVTLTANILEGKQFSHWKAEKVTADRVEDVSSLIVADPENPETATLTMPDYDIFVTAEYKDVIVDPGTGDTDHGGDIAAGVVIGGIAAVGAYEVGTGLYRITQMDDVAMPTNRLALAKLLWERAGKPEPESTALYSDISAEDEDAQKAARWAVEQELLKDDDSVEGELKFHPAFPVSKLRVCLTWENAKQKGLFDQNTEA